MVVFTCNHCGDSLQKPKVEKHYQVACRRVKSLTCVDCLKDFHGEDYDVHTKCITEQERYAAKGSIPNGVVKKGEVKQESWLNMIRSIISKEQNLEPRPKDLLETVAEYDNVPRKKHKFMNFIKSSSGGKMDTKTIEDVWNLIEKYKSEMAKPDPAVNKDEKNEENTTKRKLDNKGEDVPKKKKKDENETGVTDSSKEKVDNLGENGENVPKKKKKKAKKEKTVMEKEDTEKNDSIKVDKTGAENDVSNGSSVETIPIKKEQDKQDENITKKDKKENGVDDSTKNINGELIQKKKKKKSKKGKNESEENGVDDSAKYIKKDAEKIAESDNNAKKENSESIERSLEKENATPSPMKETIADISNNMEVDKVPTDVKITNNKEFSFEDTITKIMTKKKTTSLKKLQKKVLNAYLKHTGQSEVTPKNIKQFNKKLHKTKAIKVELDNVILL